MYEITYDKNHIVKFENLLYKNVYLPKDSEQTNGCSRLLVKTLPFQYKLYLVVKMHIYNKFIGWNEQGDIVYVHYEEMECYLETDSNIFNVTAIEVFFNVLDDYGFKRLPHFVDGGRLIIPFKHELFKRDCQHLLAQMKNSKIYNKEQKWGDINNEEQKRYLLNKRMSGDLCFMNHGNMSLLQKSRMLLTIALKFDYAERLVDSKPQVQYPQVPQYNSRKRRGSTYDKFDIPAVEFPNGMYANPYESTVHIAEYGRPFNFAGYYGTASGQQIEKFYGNLTPIFIYDPKNGITIKKMCYQKPGTCQEPGEQFTAEINPDIADVQNLDLLNDLELNMPMHIPMQPEVPNNNNDSYIHDLGDTEFAKQLVTQYKSNPGSVPKIVINTKTPPKIAEGPKKYLSMPGCENFNATKSKRFSSRAARILRPTNVPPKTFEKIEEIPKPTTGLETNVELPSCSIINNFPFVKGHNLSDSSDSSFEAPRVIKPREISPEIDFKLSESSDEPLPSFMTIKPLTVDIKKGPKENKRAPKKENKKTQVKKVKEKPVKERKKYVRAPKDPNAPPKPTKTGKKRGPYKKKEKPIVAPNTRNSGPSEKTKYILDKYLHNVDLNAVDLA